MNITKGRHCAGCGKPGGVAVTVSGVRYYLHGPCAKPFRSGVALSEIISKRAERAEAVLANILDHYATALRALGQTQSEIEAAPDYTEASAILLSADEAPL